jgi:3-(3-hydroxy-phenyl)propionate hydroxylase
MEASPPGYDEDRVLIAGGGPSGMAAALFLTSQGVPVTLLERNREPHDDPRAATYHPPSLEMLEPSGVTDELHRVGIVARKWQYRDRREGLVAEFDLQTLENDTKYPYRLQCEQHKLVAMMEKRVDGSPLATIHHDAEVAEVRQHEAGVEVVTRDAAGRETRLRGRWLIGADGGRSVVRKSQDIGFEGFTWPERFLVVTTTFDFATLGFAYSNYTMDRSSGPRRSRCRARTGVASGAAYSRPAPTKTRPNCSISAAPPNVSRASYRRAAPRR